MSLLANQEMHEVPVGQLVEGAVTSGPCRIGNFSVVGDVTLPGSFTVCGNRWQVLNKKLEPGETYQGEPGVMMYMSPEVKMEARFGGFGRIFSGEGLAKNKFTNTGQQTGYLGLTPNMPMAIVIPFDVGQRGSLNCKRGAFMAGDETVKVFPKILPASSALACCCGGMPPIIQTVNGHGTALLAAGGTIISRTVRARAPARARAAAAPLIAPLAPSLIVRAPCAVRLRERSSAPGRRSSSTATASWRSQMASGTT